MGFILAIVSRVLFLITGFINPIVVAIKYRKKHSFLKVQSEYWLIDALELDIYGNYAYRATWNVLFQKNGYEFGIKGETISSALGKNQRDNTLTRVGKVMCFILDTVDNNHCKNSIKKR